MNLVLNLLGGFDLRNEDGSLVEIGPKKAKALLAYLALAPDQRHARDKLAALLWEESAVAQARLSLRGALVSLRKALPDPDSVLITNADTVAVDSANLRVDVLEFLELAQTAKPQAWEQAVNLYRGEFLEGLNPRSFAFEDWLMEQRHQLREHALQTTVALLNHYDTTPAFEPAIGFALRALALDPLRESVQRMLMKLYARQGRYGMALKQYRLCRTLLRRELGVTPEVETERLYREISHRRNQPAPDRDQDPVGDSAKELTVRTSLETSLPAAFVSLSPVPGRGFVGRHNERRQILTACEACLETGYGQAFLIRGEAGIGKSRLVTELRTAAAVLGFCTREVLILDLGTAAGGYVLRDLVRELLRVPAAADAASLEQSALALLGESFRTTGQEQVLLNDLLDVAQPPALRIIDDAMDANARHQGKQRLVQGLIESLSKRQPLFLVVEDIHWATATILGYLAKVAGTVNHCPALLVMTSRTEGEPLDPAWRGATHGAPLSTIDLGPLHRAESRQLVEQLDAASDAFSESCIERAGGNPLFLEQLLRMDRNSRGDIPDSIQNIVQARLQKLARPDRAAAQAAAVLGQCWVLEALRQLLDDPDYPIDNLIVQRMLRSDRAEYTFTHALIRDGVYASLTPVTRRHLHRRAAAWFRERDAVLYAEHLERAQDQGAAAAYLAAASARAKTYQTDHALELIQRGLALTQDPAIRYGLIHLQAELFLATGALVEAAEKFSKALGLATTDIQRCRAWIGLAECENTRDGFDQVLEILDQAERAAATDDHAELAQIYVLRGNTFFTLGRMDDCRYNHERALSHARNAASAALEARALSGLGDAYYQQGRMRTSRRYYEHCIAVCDKHGLGRIKVANLWGPSITLFYHLDLGSVVRDCEAAVTSAKHVHNRRAEMVALDALAEVLYYVADFSGAEARARQALELSRVLGSKMFLILTDSVGY